MDEIEPRTPFEGGEDTPQEAFAQTRPGRGKRGKGRPASPVNEKRLRSIRVSVSFGEKDRIRRRAGKAGLPIAVFIRDAAMGTPLTVVEIPALAHEVRAELADIGRNLNQATKAINAAQKAGQTITLPEGFSDLLVALKGQVDAVAMTLATGIPHSPRTVFEAPSA